MAERNTHEKRSSKNNKSYMGLGVGLGVAIGTALGVVGEVLLNSVSSKKK